MSKRFSNHSLKIHTTAETVSAVTVGTLRQLAHQLNSSIIAPETGDVYDVMQVVAEQRPTMGFASYALATILNNVALAGKVVASDGTHPGIVAYAQSHDAAQANARGASGTHLSLTWGQGLLSIDRITCEKGGLAEISLTMRGTTPDGDTAPVVVAYNASLPASPVINEIFGLGKAQVLGTTVDRIQSVSIDFNPQAELPTDAGSIWPQFIDIQKVPMTTTIVTEDPEWLTPGARIEFNGKQTTASDTFLNFLKHEVTTTAAASGGSFDDFAQLVHIKGTLTGLVHVTDHYSASGAGISTTQIQIASMALSGVAPLVIDTTSAYTL